MEIYLKFQSFAPSGPSDAIHKVCFTYEIVIQSIPLDSRGNVFQGTNKHFSKVKEIGHCLWLRYQRNTLSSASLVGKVS